MFESLTLNEYQRTVSRDGHSATLTPIEYKLFYALYFANGAQITRDVLLSKAYPESIGTKYTHWNFNSAKVILCKLRKKLRPLGLVVETTRLPPTKEPIVGVRKGGRLGVYQLIDLAAKPLTHVNVEERAA